MQFLFETFINAAEKAEVESKAAAEEAHQQEQQAGDNKSKLPDKPRVTSADTVRSWAVDQMVSLARNAF